MNRNDEKELSYLVEFIKFQHEPSQSPATIYSRLCTSSIPTCREVQRSRAINSLFEVALASLVAGGSSK